jgi:DNA-binding transcriptional MerR regulator
MATASLPREQRPLTIGAVCRRLKDEFPDVSISKIRYLEDQGLLAPRRTQGGYRLFTEEDVERLRTILRLQRDEFLPLRVIRDELTAAGRGKRDRQKARPAAGLRARLDATLIGLEELCERAAAEPAFVRELESFGLVEVESDGRSSGYPESDAEVAAVCARLARYGLEPRNLRAFRTGVEREAGLLEAVIAPALRSRNPERRQGALDDLETLAGLALELSQLLFWRALRTLAKP